MDTVLVLLESQGFPCQAYQCLCVLLLCRHPHTHPVRDVCRHICSPARKGRAAPLHNSTAGQITERRHDMPASTTARQGVSNWLTLQLELVRTSYLSTTLRSCHSEISSDKAQAAAPAAPPHRRRRRTRRGAQTQRPHGRLPARRVLAAAARSSARRSQRPAPGLEPPPGGRAPACLRVRVRA